MTSRERLITTLEHQEPDRVPIDLGGAATGIELEAYEDLKRYLKIKENLEIDEKTTLFSRCHVEPAERILERLKVDTRYLRLNPLKPKIESDGSYVDEWGIKWKKPKSSFYYDIIKHPLRDTKSIKDLEKYNWPDPHDPKRTEGLRDKARKLYKNTGYALIADMVGLGIFEQSWALRGLEKFFIDMVVNREFAEALLNKVTNIHIQLWDEFLNAVGDYVEVAVVSDDVGGMNGLLMSPQLYRNLIKPAEKRLWQFIKQKAKVYLFYHCCGAIYELIPDFIELGVDILNPVQVSAKGMDTKKLKKDFGKEMTFWGGGCDTQRILPFGDIEEVREEVKSRIKDLGSGGGFVFNQVHNIQPNVPPENIIVMFETVERYSKYLV